MQQNALQQGWDNNVDYDMLCNDIFIILNCCIIHCRLVVSDYHMTIHPIIIVMFLENSLCIYV